VGGLPGPVFAKDVWILGKRPSTAWIRLIYSLLLLGVVALVFAASTQFDRYNIAGMEGIAARLQSSQEVAPSVTLAIIWSQFVMLCIIGAGLGAPAISDEIRAGSLATLLTTPLKPVQIVLGKLLSRMVELAILTLIPLPLMLALRSYGGVPAPNVLVMTGLCLSMGLLAVQLGMFFSVRFKRPAAPLVLTVIVMALLTGALPGVLAALSSLPQFAPISSQLQQAAMVLSPPFILAMNSAVLMNETGLPLFWGVIPVSLLTIAVTIVWSLIFFGATCLLLRRAMRAEDRARPSPAAVTAAAAPVATPATTTTEPASPDSPRQRKRRASTAQEGLSRVVSDRPVAWRELQQPIIGRTWMAWAIGIIVGLALLFIYYMSALEDVQIAIAIVGVVVWLLFSAVATTGTIAHEREGRTLDVLLTTPLSGWEIVWGKFIGGLRRLWIGPAFVLLHVIISGCFSGVMREILEPLDAVTGVGAWRGGWTPDVISPLVLLPLPFILIGPIVFLSATGVWFSTIFKRSTAAAICNLALALGIWAIIPIFLTIFFSGFLRGGGEELVTLWLMPNPVTLTGSAVDGCQSSVDFAVSNFEFVGPDSFRVGFFGFLGACMVFCIVYCAAALFCLRSAARKIAKGTGRSR
jgi:ABC-type transport system involved in multi-copper enzyme maturation permease subunit